MKKISVNIILICLLFFCFEDALAYTVSESSISGVPYFTPAEDFVSEMSGAADGYLVTLSADGDFYTKVYEKSYVNEQCLFKSGNKYYTISLNAPVSQDTLKSGKGLNVTSVKNYGANMAVCFTMETGDEFSVQSVSLRTASGDALIFKTEADGFISLADASGNKTRFARYSAGGKINAEIFFERTGSIFTVRSVYINGREFTEENPYEFTIGTNMSVVYRSQSGSETLKNISALSVSDYRAQYIPSGLEAADEGSGVYYNYGIKNIDSAYAAYGAADGFDGAFGSQIEISGDKLVVTNILGQCENEEFKLLGEKPILSKVQLFKNGKELYTLEDGDITVKREVLDESSVFFARYDSEGTLKQISLSKEAVHTCQSGDIIKAFVFKSSGSISPVTVAAQITQEGIFFNDGYEK